MSNSDSLINGREVCDVLGITRHTRVSWVRAGILPPPVGKRGNSGCWEKVLIDGIRDDLLKNKWRLKSKRGVYEV